MDRLPFAGFSLSEAGQLYARRVEERSRNLALESLRAALAGLSTKETAILAKSLHRVIANLSALDRSMTPGS